MSDYVHERVLRVPTDRLFAGLDWYVNKDWEKEEYLNDMSIYLSKKHTGVWATITTEGMFEIAPTSESFVDFVLVEEWDSYGEWGKTRALYDSEREKFLPLYRKLNANFTVEDMQAVRLVDFCYYNCCEAPDYYDDTVDEFFAELECKAEWRE